MPELESEITTAFQATSLLLVFVSVLFGLRYPQIRADINTEIPEGAKAKKSHRRLLRNSIVLNCLPVVLVTGMTFYLFLPTLLRIWESSHFEPWHFSFVWTSFVLVAMLVLLTFVWSVGLGVQLICRIVKSH